MNSNCSDSAKRIKFRNYVPSDKNLRKVLTVEPIDKSLVDKAKQSEKENNSDVRIDDVITKELMLYVNAELNVLPKSANWDLKKMLESRLGKLQRRTQRAIIEILRKKIEENSDSSDEDDE